MGREAKLLLGMLGLLAGVFVGVLSMKLLSPRPPEGAGPDIHADYAAAAPVAIVEPPAPTHPVGGFAAAPPLTASGPPAALVDPVGIEPPRRGSAFARPLEPAAESPAGAGGVVTTSLEEPQPERPASRFAPPAVPPDFEPLPETPPPSPAAAPPTIGRAPAIDRSVEPAPRGVYVVQSGDSWWSIAERAYGDGRLYRALFAWNRVVDPRVTLAAETPLEIPPLDRLAAAWPALVPRDATAEPRW